MKISKKILIIEDEKTLANALGLGFSRKGFIVKSALNGEEGIAMLKREDFDLILLDLVMPRVDGFGVLKYMNEKAFKTPVVVISNLSQENDMKSTKMFPVKNFFIKSNTPINMLIERVLQILGLEK